MAGVLVSVTAIVVRLGWVPLAAIIPRALSPSLRARDPMPTWSSLFLIGWTGMRGIVTLAAALALPFTTAAGQPFPFRAEIILISFAVILATLVLQGLSLTPLIRAMKLQEDRGSEEEERQAREHAATVALRRLDELAGEEWLTADHVDRLRVHYGRQLQRFAGSAPVDPDCSLEAGDTFRRLRHEILSAERLALIGLRNDGTISDELLHRLEHELDVEALRLGIGELRVSR
jgi:CPA1 family monovalent cation:H+ antiporter